MQPNTPTAIARDGLGELLSIRAEAWRGLRGRAVLDEPELRRPRRRHVVLGAGVDEERVDLLDAASHDDLVVVGVGKRVWLAQALFLQKTCILKNAKFYYKKNVL